MDGPHPQIRQVALELEERYQQELDRTAHSRFRSLSDVAVVATLHHHYALFTGRAIPASTGCATSTSGLRTRPIGSRQWR
ncbi:stealth conserved region 3 domain-containing protein [Nocardiopsis exhalans]|uniref:stealth conserved region 3 domain-containing protein n=1 Tax=Nocardiopsis exhalans TaxID=163604 RepID=UPI0031DB6F2B